MDFKEKIIRELASTASEKISRRVITVLQRMKMGLLSGVDSGLASVWDEVCVQLQSEFSFHWDACEETIKPIIADQIHQLPEFVRQSIWLQTDEGFHWLLGAEDKEDPEPPFYESDQLVDYILEEYILEQARKWSNHRIRAYLERDSRDW